MLDLPWLHSLFWSGAAPQQQSLTPQPYYTANRPSNQPQMPRTSATWLTSGSRLSPPTTGLSSSRHR